MGQEAHKGVRVAKKLAATKEKLTDIVKQRREREKQELKEAILRAAREIALHEGWQAVTIRRVAERIEYSPPTIYEYFEGKDEILTALMHEGRRLQTQAMQQAVDSVSDSEEKIFKMAEAYWDFAVRYPELYQVMHDLGGVCLRCTTEPSEQQQSFCIVRDTIYEWMHHENVTLPDPIGAVQILRATVQGLISMALTNRIEGGATRAKQLMIRAIRDSLTVWRYSTQE